MRRNDGLEVTGLAMRVSISKYSNVVQNGTGKHLNGGHKGQQSLESQRAKDTNRTHSWRPANRDVRSYKEVVKEFPGVEGEASNVIEENLRMSMICGEEEIMQMKQVRDKLIDLDISRYEINRLDDFSILITKKVNGDVCLFLEDEESQLQKRFN